MSECPNDCAALRQALDEAGEAIAALADEADLQASVAAALVECVRQEHQRAEGLLLERDVAQQEVAHLLRITDLPAAVYEAQEPIIRADERAETIREEMSLRRRMPENTAAYWRMNYESAIQALADLIAEHGRCDRADVGSDGRTAIARSHGGTP